MQKVSSLALYWGLLFFFWSPVGHFRAQAGAFDALKGLNSCKNAVSFSESKLQKSEAVSTVSTLMASGHSLRKSIEFLFSRFDDHWEKRLEDYDEHGNVRLDRLPRVHFSLENGRQKLDFIRIHIPKSSRELSEEVLKDYILLLHRDHSLRLLIATDREDLDSKIYKLPIEVRKRIKVVRVSSGLELWAQDGSKPIDLPGTTAQFGQQRYSQATEKLNEKQALETVSLDLESKGLFFQGGNIIVGDRHVFVGSAEVEFIKSRFRVSEIEAIKILNTIFQKPIVPTYLKSQEGQPLPWSFHIDLDIVVAVNRHTSREVVLVSSLEALMNAFSGETLTPRLVEKDVLRVQELIKRKYLTGEFGKPLSSGSREFFKRFSELSPSTIIHLIETSRRLQSLIRSYGYETRGLPGFGSAIGSGQSLFFGTNAILSGHQAIVPGNKMPELDQLIRSEYESLGYEVFEMPSSSKTICEQGGIRCVSETFRKPYLRWQP